MIELRGRLVVPRAPALALVYAHQRALVGYQQDDVRTFRINPEVLVIVASRRSAQAHPCLPAIGRAYSDNAGAVDGVRVFGIDDRNGQIASAYLHCRARIVGRLVPVLPRVVGAIDPEARA